MNQEFLRPRLVGLRFDEHSLPLDILKDFAALEEMLVEVAKRQYRLANPNRKRVLKGFTKELYPTAEGGVQSEWTLGAWEASRAALGTAWPSRAARFPGKASQAFSPTPEDEFQLSVDNGDRLPAEAAWRRFSADPACASRRRPGRLAF